MLASKAPISAIGRLTHIVPTSGLTPLGGTVFQTEFARSLCTTTRFDDGNRFCRQKTLNHQTVLPLLSVGDAMNSNGSRRSLSLTASRWKAVNPPVMDMKDTDIELDPDEIEFVGRKLRRFQSYGGNVWWLKKILWEFGMYASPLKKFPEHQRAIVPNTPENNKKLAKIKHCVRIDRVTFPYGYPESEADLKHMRISEHGEVTFVKEIESHVLDDGTVATIPLGVPRESLPHEMDEETIKIDCHRKVANREFLDEYHPEYDNRKLGQAHFKGLKIYWDKDKPPIVY